MFFCCITTTTRSMVSNQILVVPWPKKVLDVLENDKKVNFQEISLAKYNLRKSSRGGGGGHDSLVRPIFGTEGMGGGAEVYGRYTSQGGELLE